MRTVSLPIKNAEKSAEVTTMFDDKDFCSTCQRVVPETTEHDFKAHGGDEKYAQELKEWKQQLHETGLHHK